MNADNHTAQLLPNRYEVFQYVRDRKHPFTLVYFAIERINNISTFDSNGNEKAYIITQLIIDGIKQRFSFIKNNIFHMDSNEYILILEDPLVPSKKEINKSIKEIISNVAAPIDLNVAIGIAKYKKRVIEPSVVIKKAYYEMLLDKLDNPIKNIIPFEEALRHYELERDLKLALEKEELYTVFQPIAHKNNEVGFEALVRWNSKKYGIISPGEFIPIAEESAMIIKITEFVLKDVIRILNLHKEVSYITVNLSPNSLLDITWLIKFLDDLLADTSIDRSNITFEITEGQALTPNHWDSIKKLRNLGHSIFIDDFGKGHTNIHLLLNAIDGVKLDKEFISDSMIKEKDKFITSTISLFKALNLFVVLEGVETSLQNQFINTIQYDAVQGYLECPPIDSALIPIYLKSKQSKLTKGKRYDNSNDYNKS